MKKLLAIAILGLAVSGYAHADDASVIAVEATQGQPFDGRDSNRGDYPEPVATSAAEGYARDVRIAIEALEANG